MDYSTDQLPAFSLGSEATDDSAATAATGTHKMDPYQFERWLKNQAASANVDVEEMRRRAVDGILRYNIWRSTVK